LKIQSPRDYMLRRTTQTSSTIAAMPEEVEIVPRGPISSSGLSLSSRTFRHWPQLIIAVGVVLTLCYVAELVLVVMLVSILIAFILAPVVDFLMQGRLPRGLASLVAVLLLLGLLYGITVVSYSQASNFLRVLPKYSDSIRSAVMTIRDRAESLNPLRPTVDDKNVVKVIPSSPLSDAVTKGFGSVSQAFFALTFIPFLVYFMLSWQQHARSATVMLFRMEHRHTAYVTLGLISRMIRSFMVGNLLIGLLMATVSIAVFGALELPFFFVVGVMSGFLSLVPYLGLVLALAPPLLVGLGQMDSGSLFAICMLVLALHFIALNVLYPKFLGNRMQLNPLAVTTALLFWGWLWGAMGLILAIPITAAMKIIFDHVESLKPWGAWLGE
jgi:predicted PurR-regulated permease PerM